MRAAVAVSIVPAGGEGQDRVWLVNGERDVRITGAESFLREMPGGGAELLVKVPLSMVGREDAAFEGVKSLVAQEVGENWRTRFEKRAG